MSRSLLARSVAAVTGGSLIAVALVAPPAQAAVSPEAAVIINEIYGGGGNSGATYTHDYIELLNTSDAPVDLSAWSVQYSSSAGTGWGGVIPLQGAIAPGQYYVVQGASGGAVGAALPEAQAAGNVNLSGTNGNVALVQGIVPLTCATIACATDPAVVDLVGFGTGAAFAGNGAAPAPSNSTSATRKVVDDVVVHTADNKADFVASASMTPGAANPSTVAPAPAVDKTIAEVQGTEATSPLAGVAVRTTGVVTASYKTGGLNGFVIQTPGPDTTPGASDAIFVYLGVASTVNIGQHVTVEGTVSEFGGLTQITATPDMVTVDSAGAGAAEVVEGPWPATAADREALESMLFQPTGAFTVTNTYSTNQYGEVGLASGTTPLIQPTDVATPGSAAADAVAADNAARAVTVDDGATTNFLSAVNQTQVPPYVSLTNPVRVGAPVTFTEPVVVDFRNNTWKLNPVEQALPGDEPATFGNTRTTAPDAGRLGDGDVSLASFNVLNYFTTLGADLTGCTSYKDRAGNGITVNTCPGNGPRGAWDAANLKRQQDKIVAAINAMDADVIGLLEIENSAVLGETADEATATLVAALNAADTSAAWKHVPSSPDLPAAAQQDVISNAIIYRSDVVEPLSYARALGNLSASGQPFNNAREPIGQAFAPLGDGEPFFMVVNHFKSKGSAGPLPGDADTGDGQGSSNASRVAQATALKAWVPTVLADLAFAGIEVDDVALVGDFNSYSAEDPMRVLYEAGYTNADKHFNDDELFSYSFSGLSGSLDHVLMNSSFLARASGADVWNINSPENIALEYSRYNSHGELFYAPDAYRSSDHDPVIVAFDAGDAPAAPTTTPINLLNINDFHGRIDNDTVKFAGTIEKLRADFGDDNSLFLSNGDNIGASLFASASAGDKPTIDVLNALDLRASGVGNHEFDQGIDDLTDRVADLANFPYLGANVYNEADGTPAMQEFEILTVDGIDVGVIGAVTEETPTLVSPGGIATLEFGNPVEAVNRVAAQLSDGNADNGEADIIVAQYHEGAGFGTPEGATLEDEIADGGAFAEIVTETAASVDVIFTGHTHKEYVWSGPVPGDADATRPIVQTGSYGANIGQVVLNVDPTTKDVVSATARNVKRTTADNAAIAAAFPRGAEVASIVKAALDEAAVKGGVQVGSITADITSAFAGGSYVDGTYVGGTRDDRSSESTLGNLVANSLRDTLSNVQAGADFGVVNPGGLRADLRYAKSGAEAEDGIVTYAEANAVLPFVNNLWSTTLTGAQVKTLLEQQWQTNADGSIPSRSYLQLGLSDNVSYTYDDSRPLGDRITSITINDELVTSTDSFRVGTFSFLAQGGDNFRVLKSGTSTVDSGLIDRDAWVTYLENNANLSPSFARTNAKVVGNPATIVTGAELDMTVSKLDLTSLGSPQNVSVTATLTGGTGDAVELGQFPVANGAAQISAVVPAAAAGATTLTIVAAPSGTAVTLPLTVTAPVVVDPVVTKTTLAVTGKAVVGEKLSLTATVAPAAAGTVTFRDGTTVLGTAKVMGGKATITRSLTVGTHRLTAQFVPADAKAFKGSTSASVSVTVAKSDVTVSATLSKTKVAYGSPAKIAVTVTGKTAAPSGKVIVYSGSKAVASGTLKVSGTIGKVTITLPKTLSVKTHRLTVKYAGSASVKPAVSKAVSYKVVKATAKASVKVSPSGRTVWVTVSAKGTTPTGKVTLRVDGKKVSTVTLKDGKAKFKVAKQARGKHTYQVSYSGSKTVNKVTVTKRHNVK